MQTLNQSIENLRPEWVDAKGARFLFGICRTHLYHLAAEGKIKTAALRARGATRGKRVYSADSIAAYIERNSSVGGEA